MLPKGTPVGRLYDHLELKKMSLIYYLPQIYDYAVYGKAPTCLLKHCDLVTPYGDIELGNIAPDNDLLPAGTK